MFPLGHLGVGLKLASPFEKGLSRKTILLGTLLPDLIDKPLYHVLSLVTGREGADLGLIAGTRSFGHTILFTAALWTLARMRRSRTIAALALGTSTHLLLDLFADSFSVPNFFHGGARNSLTSLAWPLLGWQFPFTFHRFIDHLGNVFHPFIFIAEFVGALILFLEWRKARRASAAA